MLRCHTDLRLKWLHVDKVGVSMTSEFADGSRGRNGNGGVPSRDDDTETANKDIMLTKMGSTFNQRGKCGLER